MTVIYIADIQIGITTLGPGRRIVVWTEGCSLNCKGCISPELFVRRPESCREVGDIIEEIVIKADGHDGLTISGGEPFQQPHAVAALVRGVRSATSLDILIYSGYTIEEIEESSNEMRDLLKEIDILIDGRFIAEESNLKIWRGSDNQSMHLLTPSAAKYSKITNAKYNEARQMHIMTTRDGGLRLVGIPRRSASIFDGSPRKPIRLTRKGRKHEKMP